MRLDLRKLNSTDLKIARIASHFGVSPELFRWQIRNQKFSAKELRKLGAIPRARARAIDDLGRKLEK